MAGSNFNAIAGAVLATVLGTMALGIAGTSLFHAAYPEHPGFAPDISAFENGAAAGPTAPAGPPDFGRVFADSAQLSDLVARGGNLVGQCKSCHTFEDGEPNRIGPNLHDVFGRHSATHPGFEYSDGMKAHNVTWSYLTLNDFLTSPGTVVRGTKMTFAGLRQANDRMAVIAFCARSRRTKNRCPRRCRKRPQPIPAQAPQPPPPARQPPPAPRKIRPPRTRRHSRQARGIPRDITNRTRSPANLAQRALSRGPLNDLTHIERALSMGSGSLLRSVREAALR